jgi:hypothetical protein
MGDKKKSKESDSKRKVTANEEYEVEELDDPLMAMMPMSFGKQNNKKDLSASFEKTQRVVHPSINSLIKSTRQKNRKSRWSLTKTMKVTT